MNLYKHTYVYIHMYICIYAEQKLQRCTRTFFNNAKRSGENIVVVSSFSVTTVSSWFPKTLVKATR